MTTLSKCFGAALTLFGAVCVGFFVHPALELRDTIGAVGLALGFIVWMGVVPAGTPRSWIPGVLVAVEVLLLIWAAFEGTLLRGGTVEGALFAMACTLIFFMPGVYVAMEVRRELADACTAST